MSEQRSEAPVRLTTLSHGAGCACKLRQGELAEIMSRIPAVARPKALLVGTETRDDAAVWKLDKKHALVATTDFFAPLVDDPRDYGRIAAANAISDVYAMGGRPLYALNLVGWPRALGFEMLGEVLAGGAEIAAEADCPIVGGHSIDDAEPKYGLAVTGLVDPRRVLTNARAKPGDVLLLGKRLGTGIAVSAIKKGVAKPELVRAATEQMTTLNRKAGEVYARFYKSVRALTDVTGFGMLGHLDSAMRAAKQRARVDASALRILPGVRELARDGVIPSGTRANLTFLSERATFPDAMPESDRLILTDAQTNGGLLAAVDPKAAEKILRALARAGAPAVRLGEVVKPRRGQGPGVDVTGEISLAAGR
ncbi:MAG TPA: selenide, water dikinase SelD [Myxococcales bacterium]|jgi:selenide,water dikinase